LIKNQIKGIEEKLRLGAIEKNEVSDSIYNLWKSEMEIKLSKLVLLREEYEK
tara:strand:+ start:3311 stop:3466 length:156 start_codon:yes stop_codon:yes gene_type:complete